jgi:hypothetical protein
MSNRDIVMTLLESMPSFLNFLMVTLENRSIKELTFGFVTSRLLYKVSRRTEYNNTAMGNISLVAHHSKEGHVSQVQGERLLCSNCSKLGQLCLQLFKEEQQV